MDRQNVLLLFFLILIPISYAGPFEGQFGANAEVELVDDTYYITEGTAVLENPVGKDIVVNGAEADVQKFNGVVTIGEKGGTLYGKNGYFIMNKGTKVTVVDGTITFQNADIKEARVRLDENDLIGTMVSGKGVSYSSGVFSSQNGELEIYGRKVSGAFQGTLSDEGEITFTGNSISLKKGEKHIGTVTGRFTLNEFNDDVVIKASVTSSSSINTVYGSVKADKDFCYGACSGTKTITVIQPDMNIKQQTTRENTLFYIQPRQNINLDIQTFSISLPNNEGTANKVDSAGIFRVLVDEIYDYSEVKITHTNYDVPKIYDPAMKEQVDNLMKDMAKNTPEGIDEAKKHLTEAEKGVIIINSNERKIQGKPQLLIGNFFSDNDKVWYYDGAKAFVMNNDEDYDFVFDFKNYEFSKITSLFGQHKDIQALDDFSYFMFQNMPDAAISKVTGGYTLGAKAMVHYLHADGEPLELVLSDKQWNYILTEGVLKAQGTYGQNWRTNSNGEEELYMVAGGASATQANIEKGNFAEDRELYDSWNLLGRTKLIREKIPGTDNYEYRIEEQFDFVGSYMSNNQYIRSVPTYAAKAFEYLYPGVVSVQWPEDNPGMESSLEDGMVSVSVSPSSMESIGKPFQLQIKPYVSSIGGKAQAGTPQKVSK